MATVPEATSIGDHGSFGHELDKRERSAGSLLSGEMLARFESRAATYDRENRFFDQDFEELRAKWLVNSSAWRTTHPLQLWP